MDEAQIKALLAATQQTILDTVNQSISGAIARTQKETDKRFAEFMTNIPKSTDAEKPAEGSLELKALTQQLADMKAEREADRTKAQKTQRDNAILSELGGRKLVAASTLREVMAAKYSDRLTEENGKWFVKDGDTAKPFNQVVTEFLASDDGLVFTPPASTVQGNGSKVGNVQSTLSKPQTMAEAFQNALKR